MWRRPAILVFSFLYFGCLFRVSFLERPLFQLGILNLHAIGNKPGNLFYEHLVFWPVADFFRPPMFFNVFSASNDFLPQHRPLQRRLRNQNHWVWHKSNKSSCIIYFTVVFGHLKKSLSFRRSHFWRAPNMCKILIYTALQMQLDVEKVNWWYSLWVKLKW